MSTMAGDVAGIMEALGHHDAARTLRWSAAREDAGERAELYDVEEERDRLGEECELLRCAVEAALPFARMKLDGGTPPDVRKSHRELVAAIDRLRREGVYLNE